ncbi:MAG: hypothetical protein K9N09_07860 [Candidatus Cloacimonetes bacterium]|nr:hypothetical protein [Candidatus Cloacimonadota bacterium]MCF7813479.1 hypothetical protein [Candidatus Cloacimonadota bacterium]MCF7868598.1 hypothetical protein [Candidatus Cloacimonadota bacterium]MCF7883385.1 hypothetical protein [Candidatus Cloacimonadota bacterium]
MKKIVVLSLISVFVFTCLQAADLEETLESLSGEAAESYVSPIVSAFGTNLNGGWFHWAPKDKLFGLDVEFGMVLMSTMFPDDDKSFDATGAFQFNQNQAENIVENSGISSGDYGYDELVSAIMSQEFEIGIHGATIIGEEDDHVMLEFPEQTVTVDIGGSPQDFDLLAYSQDSGVGGLLDDYSMLPLGAPQLSIGTIYGTKAAFRFVPSLDIEDLGKFDYFGFGVQHNPKAWLKVPIPIDLCFSYFTQTMKLGDIVEANATAFGLNVSKTFGASFLSVTPYAGYMLESSNMKFKYSYELGTDPISGTPLDPMEIKFDIDGKNKSRLTLGTTFRLGVFNINADYNIGKYNSFTAGFALGF